MSTIETERLILRRWRAGDLEPFAALNADPKVMEFFPAPLTRDEAAFMIARMEAKFVVHGFCFWAVEEKQSGRLAGFTGLNRPDQALPFAPCVEVGWRLAREFWGRGYASEAGRAALAYGFGALKLPEIVAFTVPGNIRSRAVMERLGLAHDLTGDFEHPGLPEGHRLRHHMLYRQARPQAV